MSASTTAMTSSTSAYTTGGFWERLWRMSGINFVAFVIIAYVIYGHQPQVGASADALAGFYDGDRMRILIAAVFYGLADLNPMWFEGALRTPWRMRDKTVGAGRRPPPVPPRSAFPLAHRGVAALAYSIAGSGNHMLTSGPNEFVGRLRVDFVPARDAYHGRGV